MQETNPTNPTGNNSYSPNKSCTRAIGISCLVFLLIFGALTYWVWTLIRKSPSIEDTGKCMVNLSQISGALDRYKQKKGEYPKALDDLYPDFLEDGSVLFCPSDKSHSSKSSYEYKVPNKKDSPNAIVVCCKRHRAMNTQMWLCVQKNGKLRIYTLAPNKGNEPIPGIEIDPKSLQE